MAETINLAVGSFLKTDLVRGGSIIETSYKLISGITPEGITFISLTCPPTLRKVFLPVPQSHTDTVSLITIVDRSFKEGEPVFYQHEVVRLSDLPPKIQSAI